MDASCLLIRMCISIAARIAEVCTWGGCLEFGVVRLAFVVDCTFLQSLRSPLSLWSLSFALLRYRCSRSKTGGVSRMRAWLFRSCLDSLACLIGFPCLISPSVYFALTFLLLLSATDSSVSRDRSIIIRASRLSISTTLWSIFPCTLSSKFAG
jgi:hypothetical protein